MCTKNHDHMKYASWDMECDTYFLSFWPIYCPFTPLLTTTIKIWRKCKKKPGDIILLHMCTINEDHMMHGSWDIRHPIQNFLSFWTIFCSFVSLTTQKLKNFEKKMKKKKTPGDIILLHKCTINDNHIMYSSWDMKCDRQDFLSFWAIFALLPH